MTIKYFKVKDNVDLKEFEKLGFRKHKQDSDDVYCSKWSRNWVEADTIDGYPCGSSGWEFYPQITIYKNRSISFYIDSGYGKNIDYQLFAFFDIVKADLIEIDKKKLDEKDYW